MSGEGFIPLSNQLGIPGSSYMIQLGKINGKWAARLARGNEVLDSVIFKDTEGDDPPNANQIVAWVIQTLPIPNINPYQIAKSVGFIRQEAVRNNERAKKKPAISVKEAKEAKLEPVPEEAKKRQTKAQVGWVKEERLTEEDKRGMQHRVLPKIPTGGAETGAGKAVAAGEGIKCIACGNIIKYCPYCGKPLKEH